MHRERVYIDGVEAPSVTTVLSIVDKPFLKIWFGKLGLAKAQEIVKDSQELGKRVHEAIEGYFQGSLPPDLSQQEAQMFSLFKGWAIDTRFNPTELEHYVESREHHFHGTMDAIGHFGDDKLVICDWKTSAMIDDLYGAQLAAYAQGYKEETGIEITEGLVVRVDKKPDAKKPLEVKRFSNLPKYFEVFLRCKDIWCFVNKKGVWAKDKQ